MAQKRESRVGAKARDSAKAENEEVWLAPSPGRVCRVGAKAQKCSKSRKAWRYCWPHPQAEGLRPIAESPSGEQTHHQGEVLSGPDPRPKKDVVEHHGRF